MNELQHNAIIFVGGPGQSKLRKAAGHPVCLLPIPGRRSLLHSWVDTLKTTERVHTIDIVTGRTEDAESLQEQISPYESDDEISIGVHVDEVSHRGTAGALKDFIEGRQGFENLMFIEGNRIPPEYPEALFCKDYELDDVSGVLGRTSGHETAGMVLMKKEMLDLVPEMGFFDFKEQLIPRVLDSGSRILVKEITRRSIRLSTPQAYLRQLIEYSPLEQDDASGPYISSSAHVDSSSILGRNVIVGPNAWIDANCLIQDSVIMEGARVGPNSTLIRSIITRNSTVDEGTSSVRMPHDLKVRTGTLRRKVS